MREQVRQQYLQAMGIQLWETRATQGAVDTQAVHQEAVADPVQQSASRAVLQAEDTAVAAVSSPARHLSDWESLQQRVADCQSCGLHEGRISTVFGTGNHQADVMFIGEAPGADEDRQGEPFVGRAGQLLNEMLQAIGLSRERVFIANILKCRPPNNRDPRPEEVLSCETYLYEQIRLVQPGLIVALGRIAAHNLLKTDTSLGHLRGQWHDCPGVDVPVIVTYHPAYLLRSPLQKRKAFDDLLMVLDRLAQVQA